MNLKDKKIQTNYEVRLYSYIYIIYIYIYIINKFRRKSISQDNLDSNVSNIFEIFFFRLQKTRKKKSYWGYY